MNFFEHQRQARRESGFLLVLFFCAVVCIVLAVNAAILVGYEVFLALQPEYAPISPTESMQWRAVIVVCATPFTLLVIALGSVFKTGQLRFGQGGAVAERVGARRISADTSDLGEKRLVNVVEEMSIASGANVPSIWVMDEEEGINAFVAGYVPSEATLVVSKGCLENLTRDELQGVVAHEFSHIFNGDMRTNIRMLGLLHGILAIGLGGYGILRVFSHSRPSRSSSSKKNDSSGAILLAILVVAVLLIIVGYVGVFFGRWIKASLSRAREYLADASAVQFTRNPTGIAGALAKIQQGAGSRLVSKNAEQFSHFFFADGVGLSLLFATHPPLEERLGRILPDWKSALKLTNPVQPPPLPSMREAAAQKRGIVDSIGTSSLGQIAVAAEILESIPATIHKLCAIPQGAQLIFAALLTVENEVLPTHAAALLTSHQPLPALQDAHSQLRRLGQSKWLAVAELCMPSLQQLNADQRADLLSRCQDLILADGKTSSVEASLLGLLERSLAPSSEKRKARYHRLEQIKTQMVSLAAFMAREGHADAGAQYQAFRQGLEKCEIAGYLPEQLPQVAAEALPQLLKPIAQASSELKEVVIRVLAEVSLSDGTRSARETEILRTVSAAVDCPIPPMV